jgi:hypothetical protein
MRKIAVEVREGRSRDAKNRSRGARGSQSRCEKSQPRCEGVAVEMRKVAAEMRGVAVEMRKFAAEMRVCRSGDTPGCCWISQCVEKTTPDDAVASADRQVGDRP